MNDKSQVWCLISTQYAIIDACMLLRAVALSLLPEDTVLLVRQRPTNTIVHSFHLKKNLIWSAIPSNGVLGKKHLTWVYIVILSETPLDADFTL